MSHPGDNDVTTTFLQRWGIWLAAFGYFACYVPFSVMTKMVTSGIGPFKGEKVDQFTIQAVMTMGSVVVAYTFITIVGWWKFATHSKVFGVSIARPQWFTLISGLCASFQIITTTLAYTFKGVSILFVMLFLRGGVLMIAPVVDVLNGKRKVHLVSWIASGLSLTALVVASYDAFKGGNTTLPALLIVDIIIYLAVYFGRLWFMSDKAKTADPEVNKRYFVEEQMVAAPGLLIMLAVVGFIGHQTDPGGKLDLMWQGFTSISPGTGLFWFLFATGMMSTGTGIFGSLIFLDKRENTYTVPVNRASSILAGLAGGLLLHYAYKQKFPKDVELFGAGLLVAAIVVLMTRPILEKRARDRAAAAAATGSPARLVRRA